MVTEHEMAENLNYVHCVFQELEDMGIELPMGDYEMVYKTVEEARDYFDSSRKKMLPRRWFLRRNSYPK